jgi:hypothetical protein
MPESLRTTIGQFSSSGGRWQARAANARAVEPASELPSAQRGSLYILVEVSGAEGGHAALYRQVLNAAQTAFYEMGETVESALRQAVRSAHAVLRRANEGLPEAQWRAGISLVVRYGDQLVIAQAGPGLMLVSHERTIDQFPAQLGVFGPALGGEERPDVNIYDTTVEPGSMVLMAQSDWPNHVAPEALAVAAAASSVSLATQYLGQLAGNADLTALLVGFSRDIPELRNEDTAVVAPASLPAEPVETPAEEPARRSIFGGRRFGKSRNAEEPTVKAAEPEPVHLPVSPVEVVPPVEEPPPAAAPVTPRAAQPEAPAAPTSRAFRSPYASAAWDAPPSARPPRPVRVEPLPTYQPPAAVEPAAEYAEEELEEAPRRSPWWLLIALVVIPLLIAGIVLAMLYGRSNAIDAQVQEKLDGAANIITQAETMTDEAAAIQHLAGARDFLDQVIELRPNDERLDPVETRYIDLLNKLERVTPLYGVVPLWEFQEETRQLDRVLVSGDAVFALDRGAMRVYRFTRSSLGDSVTPADKPLVSKGEQVGDLAVGDLVDMAWVESASAGQRSKLVVLDNAGGLVGYDVTWGPERLALPGRDRWGEPRFILGYGGNLYVVDVGGNQIWRYRPAANGFSDPEPYFAEGTQVNLSGLQAVAIDGNIWLLYSDGRLLKFFGGQGRSFVWQGLPGDLSAPTAVVVPIEGDRLYVADAGNGRIIEATKEGVFLRQFRAREGDLIRNLKSLFLDEAGSMFYVLTQDQLYKIDIPAPGSTPAGLSATPTAAP